MPSSSSHSDGSLMQALVTYKSKHKMRYMRTMAAKLPDTIKYRLLALKALQVEGFKRDVEYQKAKFELQQKYKPAFEAINDKRYELLSGKVAPAKDEKPKWEKKDETVELDKEDLNKIQKMVKRIKPIPKTAKGIPGFWLMVLKLIESFDDHIWKQDELVLRHLVDIKLKESTADKYVIEFHFDENNGYFTNQVLTKEYTVKTNMDDEKPLAYEANEVVSSKGCVINWLPGKKLPRERKQKKLSDAGDPKDETLTKGEPAKVDEAALSFFNFFDMNENTNAQFTKDSDIALGLLLHDKVIPKAVLYLTGDLLDKPEEEDSEEEDEAASEHAASASASASEN